MSIFKFFHAVPEKTAYIIEAYGKYKRTLLAGPQIINPFNEKVVHKCILKDDAINISSKKLLTKDNVSVDIDGALFFKITDAYKSIYEIDNHIEAMKNITNTSLRGIIGELNFDKIERKTINENIIDQINKEIEAWGTQCFHYEIIAVEHSDKTINLNPDPKLELVESKRRAEEDLEIAIKMKKLILQTQLKKALLEAEKEISKIRLIKQKEALDIIIKALGENVSKDIIDFIMMDEYLQSLYNENKNIASKIMDENQLNIKSLAKIISKKLNSGKNGQKDNEADNNIKLSSIDEYENIIKQFRYYDSPELYSTDEELEEKEKNKEKKELEPNSTKEMKKNNSQ